MSPRGAAGGRALWLAALAALLAAGAALRFSTLDLQSFWLDEAVTHQLVLRPLGAMLRAIPHSESTPPLYYVLAWVWVRVFSAGEVGLRSLSALIGTATIVPLALLARRVAGPRAGLAAAALAAANPLLIWYSQEARAYALLVALCAVASWRLAERDWLGWGVAAALALATHYFAIFIVAPQLAWVAWRQARRSRPAALGCAAVVVVGAALLPLAVVQAGGDRAGFIHSTGLGSRVVAVPKQLLIGYDTPHQTVLTVLAVLLAVALAAGLRRRDRALMALAAVALGVPLLLALAGADYLITRNVIAALVPLVVLAGAAATRTRAGPWLVAGLCALGVLAYAGIEGNGRYQRDDWRGVAQVLGPARYGARAVVLTPASGAAALAVYLPLARAPDGAPVSAREIDVVDLSHHPPAIPTMIPMEGFVPCAEPLRTPEFVVERYCPAVPGAVSVLYSVLENLRVVKPGPAAAILVGG